MNIKSEIQTDLSLYINTVNQRLLLLPVLLSLSLKKILLFLSLLKFQFNLLNKVPLHSVITLFSCQDADGRRSQQIKTLTRSSWAP